MITLMTDSPSAPFMNPAMNRILVLAKTEKPSPSTWQTLRRALDLVSDEEIKRLPSNLLQAWPEDLSRPPAQNWTGRNPRLALARSVKEVDLYNTYRRRIAEAFGQDAFLIRQFTGSCIPKSRVEAACKLIHANQGHGAIKVLRGGEVQIGIPGTADLGGFLLLTVRGQRVPVPLHVEVKVKGGTEDPDQTMVRQGLLRKNICAILADDIDDAIAQIREYKERWEQILS
jgi:hypothetical protein